MFTCESDVAPTESPTDDNGTGTDDPTNGDGDDGDGDGTTRSNGSVDSGSDSCPGAGAGLATTGGQIAAFAAVAAALVAARRLTWIR